MQLISVILLQLNLKKENLHISGFQLKTFTTMKYDPVNHARIIIAENIIVNGVSNSKVFL